MNARTIDDASEPETSEPIASAQVRQREGLPPQYRMRAERHYVDHLSAPSSSVPVQLIPITQLAPPAQSASKDLDPLVRSIRAHGSSSRCWCEGTGPVIT